MWVRGLKHLSRAHVLSRAVAPYVGAWIETLIGGKISSGIRSHPMWVRGLKQILNDGEKRRYSRTLCGCVD